MIDYIKLKVIDINIDTLLKNPKLNFVSEINEETAVIISNKKIAKYHFCEIIVYDTGIVIFRGSIHKMWNSLNSVFAPNYNKNKIYKGFNGNQFSLDEIIKARNHLCNLFKCYPKQLKFQNIEFGINNSCTKYITQYINNLLYHRNVAFEFRFKRNYAEVEHQRYRLKIYNKSYQYEMEQNTLRTEINIKKMVELKGLNIVTFNDINTTTIKGLETLLLKRLCEIVYYDFTIKNPQLHRTKNKHFYNYSNINFWLNDLEPNKRYRHKMKLQHIIENYSDNIFADIKKEIVNKCSILNRLSKKVDCSLINHSNTLVNKPQIVYQRYCQITGLDLRYENYQSRYIRTKTLRYLNEFDTVKYIEVCSLLLKKSNPYHTKYETDIIKHLAKQVRNRYYNLNRIRDIGYNSKLYTNQYCLRL